VRWWHAVVFYVVLLAAVTGASHAMRSSASPVASVASVGPVAASAPPASSSWTAPAPVSAPPTRAGRPTAASPPRTTRSSDQAATGRPGARLTLVAHGVVLPDRHATPGAINPAVTQANIHSTICVAGYTSTIRPASSYTTALKQRQLAAGYQLRGDTDTGDYEEDHLIALELGGSPRSVNNLWPEPYATRQGARVKDTVENALHSLVCDGSVTLRAAQSAIAGNWWRAYQHYVHFASTPTVHAALTHSPTPASSYTPPPPTTPAAAPVQHSCTTTSSGSCIRGGQFCPQASYGKLGYDAGGDTHTCTGDATHPHWQ
jgi:hypothetical protein